MLYFNSVVEICIRQLVKSNTNLTTGVTAFIRFGSCNDMPEFGSRSVRSPYRFQFGSFGESSVRFESLLSKTTQLRTMISTCFCILT